MAQLLVVTDRGIGLLRGDVVALLRTEHADLGAALEAGTGLADLAASEVTEEVALSSVTIRPPVAQPRAFWAVGLNYAEHVAEINGAALSEPFIFPKTPSAIVAAGEPIRIPESAPDTVDFEGEMTLLIGREARNVAAADAWAYVAGITICNDVSARSVQKGAPGKRANISMAKSYDTFAPVGPAVAVLDTISDPDDLAIRTYVNDELRQSASTKQMIFDVPTLLEFLTARVTLQPGDLIATGTPEGVGDVDGRYLAPGDTVRIELDQVGTLSNPVTSR